MMKRWHMIIDLEKCIGCYNCLMACKDEHVGNEWKPYTLSQKRHDQKWINPELRERGQHPVIDVAYLPRLCQHCEDAHCAKTAPDAVKTRQDGIVLFDIDKSRNKEYLVNACPYGAVSWNEERGVPQKCTFCAHLLDKGWEKPRCVQACPLGALRALNMEESEFDRMVKEEKLEQLKPQLGKKTGVWYKNLYRYNKCFLAGSIAFMDGDIERCAKDCMVTLMKDGAVLGLLSADSYGEFKFDRLEPDSGSYTLVFQLEGYEKQAMDVVLAESRSIGTVNLKKI